jgi:hypothetical protein
MAKRKKPAPLVPADEALRGGWTIRQLNRQINSRFYEHVALDRCLRDFAEE